MRLLKNILFAGFFLVLLSAQLRFLYSGYTQAPLNGVYVSIEKPVLNVDNWVSGKFQEQFMRHYEQDLPLHPTLLRIRNQINYSLFDEMNAKGIEEGKNRMLFESGYVKTYLGEDFIGDSLIKRKVEMLLYVQSELKKRNIDLLFVMAPSKATVLPEYIPAKYDLIKKTRNNYEGFTEQFAKQHINHLNITRIFLEKKSNSKYPLFTSCGIHWSGYGATLAADTTFKYLERLRGIDLPDFSDVGGEESYIPRGTDADIGALTNLLIDIPSTKMYYPNIVFKKDSSKTRPNLLMIGDSFAWSWITFYTYIPELFNDKSSFWYYNHHVGWSGVGGEENILTKDYDLKKETLSRDVILIVNTEPSLNNAGQFFIEQMFEMLHANPLTPVNQ